MIIGKFIIKFHSPITIKRAGYMKEVIDALKKGYTLLAIKTYKQHTGVGLKKARDYIVNVLKPKYYKPNKTTTEFMNAVEEHLHKLPTVDNSLEKPIETTDDLRVNYWLFKEIAKYQATQFNK
jgi:hypothetical protein